MSLVSSTPVGSDLLHRANSQEIELSDSCFQHHSNCNSPAVVASNFRSQNQTRKQVVNTQHGRGRNVSGRFWWTHSEHFPAHVFSRNPAQTSAARKRNVDVDRNESTYSTTTQRSQLNDDVPAPANHDHNVFAREESTHAVIQTTVQLMVFLGFHDRPRDPRIATNVYPQALVTFGIMELSAVDDPYCTTVAQSRVVVFETVN